MKHPASGVGVVLDEWKAGASCWPEMGTVTVGWGKEGRLTRQDKWYRLSLPRAFLGPVLGNRLLAERVAWGGGVRGLEKEREANRLREGEWKTISLGKWNLIAHNSLRLMSMNSNVTVKCAWDSSGTLGEGF